MYLAGFRISHFAISRFTCPRSFGSVLVGVREIPERAVAFRAASTFFQLAFNLSFSPSSPPLLLSPLHIKMAEVKVKTPKEFAGMSAIYVSVSFAGHSLVILLADFLMGGVSAVCPLVIR
jgi:hypothetical protein